MNSYNLRSGGDDERSGGDGDDNKSYDNHTPDNHYTKLVNLGNSLDNKNPIHRMLDMKLELVQFHSEQLLVLLT
jgi:hypothetical protein